MIKLPDSNSDSDDSDTPSLSHHKTKKKITKSKSNIKSKLLNLQNKNNMRKSPIKKSSIKKSCSVNISPLYPSIITPPLADSTSPLPPNYNIHTNPSNNFSPRLCRLPSLIFPSYLHNSIPLEDTSIDNSSKSSFVHNVWQSTKIYPPTPPPMKLKDFPLTSVTRIITPPESRAKIYSSLLFPPESFEPKLTTNYSSLFHHSFSFTTHRSVAVSECLLLFLRNIFHSPIKNFSTIVLFCCICNLSIAYSLYSTPFSPHNALFYSIINFCTIRNLFFVYPIHNSISLLKTSSSVCEEETLSAIA